MIDRRDFMIGGGIVAGAMLLKPALDIGGASAASPDTGTQVPGYYRTKVGGVQVTALLDGGMEFSDDLFTSVGATPEELTAAKTRNFLDPSKGFPAYVNGFLVQTGSKVILIDSGAGAMFGDTTGKLERNLAAAGVTPEQIDEIILTHGHPDHAGGLLNAAGERVFPKAVVRIDAQDLNFWYDDAAKARLPEKAQMFEMGQKLLGPYRDSGQIQTFKGGDDLGGGISTIPLYGHTPGHSGLRISDGNEQLVIWGDIVHLPALQFANPARSIGFDIDPDQARATRQKILDEVEVDRIRVAGMHLCFPGIGHVARFGSGYEFIPQMFETTL